MRPNESVLARLGDTETDLIERLRPNFSPPLFQLTSDITCDTRASSFEIRERIQLCEGKDPYRNFADLRKPCLRKCPKDCFGIKTRSAASNFPAWLLA